MKKLLCLTLAVTMVIVGLVLPLGTFSAAAYDYYNAPPNSYRLPVYTPSSGVSTFNINFAMPGAWMGAAGSSDRATWEKYGSSAGIYWWGSMDNPDEARGANGRGWPGWKMKRGDKANLYTSLVPKGTAYMIFNNFIDGGMDESYPEYNASQQTMDLTALEFQEQGDSDYYPLEFWDYLYTNYEAEFEKNPNYQIPEFGNYAKNFFYDEYEIYHYIDDMVFVVDTVNTDKATVSPATRKAGLAGAFYFYYGNGEFGIWPTKEMCIEKEGLPVDAVGNIDYSKIAKEEEPTTVEATTAATEESIAVKDDTPAGADYQESTTTYRNPSTDSTLRIQKKTGFIKNKHTDAYDGRTKRDFVVFGNFTGKYWADSVVPPAPAPEPGNPFTPSLYVDGYGNSANVSWSTVNDAAYYILYYKKASDANWSSKVVYNGGSSTFSSSVRDEVCYFQIQPVYANGEKGKFSSVKSYTFNSSTPTLYVNGYGSSASVSWSTVYGAANYILYYKKAGDANWSSKVVYNGGSSTFSSSVEKDVYYFQIQPVFANGEKGKFSSVKSYIFNIENKIYFQADTNLWRYFKTITCYLYEHDEHGGDPFITWGSTNGNMTNTGDGIWEFDLDKAGITLESGKQYGVIFTADWGAQSCDLILDIQNLGDIAYLNGKQVENNIDSNKKSYVVKWKSGHNGNPVCITSIGNVIGDTYWQGENAYKTLLNFIKSDGKDGLSNAIKFNGKTEQQTLDDTAKKLGLNANDIERAIKESGKQGRIRWSKNGSASGGGSSGSGSTEALSTTINSISYNSNATVTLSWSKAFLANKYEIAKKKLNDKNYTKLYTTSTTFNDRSVSCGTIYYYQIRPLYTSGASTIYGTWSNVKAITTLYRPTITNMNITSARLNINWNKIKGVTKYKVAFKRATDKAWNYREATSNYYNVVKPTPNAVYYVQVCPMNGSIMGQYSKASSIALYTIAKPVVSAKFNGNSVDLSWKAVPGATGYQIAQKSYYDTDFYYYYVNTPSFTDYNVGLGISNYYQVRAYSGSTYGPWSSVATVLTLQAPEVEVYDSWYDDYEFEVDWDYVYGADSYIVAYKTASEPNWHYITTYDTYCELYAYDSDLYYIQVCAIGDGGVQGPYSRVYSYRTY